MPDAAELLMPKLGLTMTEGRVARWAVEPGVRFAAGQVVVEIETDKIVNEVEAPSGGVLVEHVVPEGTTMPVGAAIARWRLDAGAATVSPSASAEDRSAAIVAAARADSDRPARWGARTVSTPYARTLAARAALDISVVQGSGPGGRINAADVERAIRQIEAAKLPARVGNTKAAPSAASLSAAGATLSGRALSFVTCDVEMSRLDEVEARVTASALAARPDRRHYVALACLRALATDNGAGILRIGLETEPGAGKYLALAAPGGISLSALTALHASSVARHREETSGRGRASAGQVLILAGSAASHAFAPNVPAGWAMAIGIGAVREVFRADAAGAPNLAREMTLALSYDAGELAHAGALELIGTLKSLLEEPLGMLVT